MKDLFPRIIDSYDTNRTYGPSSSLFIWIKYLCDTYISSTPVVAIFKLFIVFCLARYVNISRKGAISLVYTTSDSARQIRTMTLCRRVLLKCGVRFVYQSTLFGLDIITFTVSDLITGIYRTMFMRVPVYHFEDPTIIDFQNAKNPYYYD